jgi:hypothetical protein
MSELEAATQVGGRLGKALYIKYNDYMTLRLDNLPDHIERALRERARTEQKSLDQAAVDAMARGLGVSLTAWSEPTKFRDLSDIAGTGGIDDEMEAVFWEHRRIDPEI